MIMSTPITFRRRSVCAIAATALQLATLTAARADEEGAPSTANAADVRRPAGNWDVTLGLVVLDGEKYPGSSKRKLHIYPLGEIVYKDRFFFKGDSIPGATIRGLGAYLFKDQHWGVTASIAPDFTERREQDDVRLRGLGNVAMTMRGALAASYSRDWWRITAGITQDLSNKKKEGVKGGLDFAATYHATDRITLNAGPGVTFANGENTRAFFGVTPLQSTRSGYAVYTPKGGPQSVRFSTGMNYRLGGGWFTGAFVSESKLLGDAANSPFIEKKQELSVGTYIGHHF
jgi:outer membrane protein